MPHPFIQALRQLVDERDLEWLADDLMDYARAVAASAVQEHADAIADRVADRLAPGRAADVYTSSRLGPWAPAKTRKWMLLHLKTMPGAHKVGRDWLISRHDYDLWAGQQDAAKFRTEREPSDEEIAERALSEAGLRRNGESDGSSRVSRRVAGRSLAGSGPQDRRR